MGKKRRRFEPPDYLKRVTDAFEATGLSVQGLADKAGLRYWEAERFLAGAFGGNFDKWARFCWAMDKPWQEILTGERVGRIPTELKGPPSPPPAEARDKGRPSLAADTKGKGRR